MASHAAVCSTVLPSRRKTTSLFDQQKGDSHFFVASQTYADIWGNKLQACTAGVPVFTQLLAVYLFALCPSEDSE
jgi:hypothetical protein